MKRLSAAAAFFALALLGACATNDADAAAPEAAAEAAAYRVVAEDVSIPFAERAITNFRVGEDRSLILRANGRFYRATLDSFCQRDLRWANAIGVASGQSTFDRFGWVLIDGRRCQLNSLDEIEDPNPPRFDRSESE